MRVVRAQVAPGGKTSSEDWVRRMELVAMRCLTDCWAKRPRVATGSGPSPLGTACCMLLGLGARSAGGVGVGV